MSDLYRKMSDVIRTAQRATVAELAHAWLLQYGPTGPQSDRSSISATVNANVASACTGAKEAKEYLELAIQQHFGEISGTALKMAEAHLRAGEALLSEERT